MLKILCDAILLIVVGAIAALLVERKLRQQRMATIQRLENPGGMAEEGFVRVGGIDQWIRIRGESAANPVLLVVHGGPGSSYSIFTPHLRSWEKHFTIVQWDQRGAGRTFAGTGPRATGALTMEQLTRDGIELAEYLCARLQKERIFLLASSFGSTFGLAIVRRRPDLFYAYIGADQNVGMVRGAAENHCELLQRLRSHGMTKAAAALERIGADPARWTHKEYTTVTRCTMKSDPRGFRQTKKLLKDAIWYAPGFGLRDIHAYAAGMRYSLEQLLPELCRFDAWAQGTRFEVPFFIFQGEHDVLTTPKLARAYFEDVAAPSKRMELVAEAGHFVAFLRPEPFLALLLRQVRPLADVLTTAPVAQATMQ